MEPSELKRMGVGSVVCCGCKREIPALEAEWLPTCRHGFKMLAPHCRMCALPAKMETRRNAK